MSKYLTKDEHGATMRRMQRFLIFMMMVLGLVMCPVMAQDLAESADEAPAKEAAPTKEELAEMREARKEASAYVKDELKRNKKLASLLKKVKDAKSAKKQAEKILELTGSGKTNKTALGDAGPATRPTGPAMDEERKKRARELKTSYAKLIKQVEAFNELEIEDCEEYDDIKTALDNLPGLSEAQTGFPEE